MPRLRLQQMQLMDGRPTMSPMSPMSPISPMSPMTEINLAGEGEAIRLRTPQGVVRITGVRRVEPEEELLLAHLPPLLPGGRALVPLPHGAPALPAVLAAAGPTGTVEVWEPDLHAARLLRAKLAPLANVRVGCTPDPEPAPAAAAQAGFLIIRRDSDRLLAFDLLERFSSVLPPASPVWVVLPQRRASDFRPRLIRLLDRLREVARTREHLLLAGQSLAQSVWTPRLCHFRASTPKVALELVSRPGVFCHGRPDAGGTALAECVELATGEAVLELGCGGGTTSLLLAAALRAAGGVPGRLVLVDSHARAVACAQANAAANGFAGQAEVVQDDAYAPAPASFDWFLGNPPYYADQRICDLFLRTAATALRPGGRAAIVSKHGPTVRELAAAHGLRPESSVRRRGYDVDFLRQP